MSKKFFILLVSLLFCTFVNAEITYKTYTPVVQQFYNEQYHNYGLSRPKHNYKKTIKQSLNEYFSGQLTGFTPQINPLPYTRTSHNNVYSNNIYPIYPYPYTYRKPYERQQQIQYSTPFGNGYRFDNYGANSSSSVKIID